MKGGNVSEPYYRQDAKGVLKALDTHVKKGLTKSEARKRMHTHGLNQLPKHDANSALTAYLKQYKNIPVITLLFLSFVSFIAGENQASLVLFIVGFCNALISYSQDHKAIAPIALLNDYSENKVKVVRDSGAHYIGIERVVPGDIVFIQAGDLIPADMRIIEQSNLVIDQAVVGGNGTARKFTHALSGNVPTQDRHNQAYMGSRVTNGSAYGVVIATGKQTELGILLEQQNAAQSKPSPLQKELHTIALRSAQVTILICIALLPFAAHVSSGRHNIFVLIVMIAAAMIPLGLPAIIDASLARAAHVLGRYRILINKLSAVDSLGSSSVAFIAVDSMLMQPQVTATEIVTGQLPYRVGGNGFRPNGVIKNRHGKTVLKDDLKSMELLFACGVFTSDAQLLESHKTNADWKIIGNNADAALLTLARKAGLNENSLRQQHEEVKLFPYDAARKRLSSVRIYEDSDQLFVFVKGSPEHLLHRCDSLWTIHGKRRMSVKDRDQIDKQRHAWALDAKQSVGLAYKVLPKNTNLDTLTLEEAETNLTWLGAIALDQATHKEAQATLQKLSHTGVRTILHTDASTTIAEAIAQKLLAIKAKIPVAVISGEELQNLSEDRLLQMIASPNVILSQPNPSDYAKLVSLAAQHHIVSVVDTDDQHATTGDVNIGIGSLYTDISLATPRPNPLIKGILQSRSTYQNIQKSIASALASNVAQLIVIALSILTYITFDTPLALTIMQILAIDLVIELFPAIALAWDKPYIKNKALNHSHILTKGTLADILWSGTLIGALAFGNFIMFFMRNDLNLSAIDTYAPTLYAQATTLVFVTIVVCQIINILQRRSPHGLFTRQQFHNRALFIALIGSAVCIAAAVYNPIINSFLGTTTLYATDWLYVALAAAVFIVIREIQRYANTHHNRNHILELLKS